MKNLRKLLAKMNERIGKMSASELINRIERDKGEKIDFEIVQDVAYESNYEYHSALKLTYDDLENYNDYCSEEEEIWTSIKAS